MVVHHWVESRAQADDVIRARVRTIKKHLAEFDPAFDGAFRERLDAIGRPQMTASSSSNSSSVCRPE